MTKSYWIRILYGNMAHVNNKFERKTTNRRFHGRGIFLRQRRRRGKCLAPRIALQNACQKENERFSIMPFLLSHFSLGDKIENCSAQFLAVCWIVHVEFKVHCLRDGFSVSNTLLLANRSQRSSAITSIRLETERFSKDAICSSLFRCSSRTVRLSFGLFLFFLDFAIRSFYTSFLIADHAGWKQ